MPEAPTCNNETVLRAVNLAKRFAIRTGRFSRRGLRAVDAVSLVLRRGETLGIVGESGSGKSTLARMLLRLIDATSGAVYYQGRDLLRLPEREMRDARRHLQMIFQDPYASLHPLRTVAEIVSEPWKVHRGLVPPARYRQEVEALLAQVGMPPSYARVYPASLSGGERQRVAIARALALRPEVLILDEPVSALDVSIQAQVIKLLMQLQRDLGMAYVFISHDLQLVRLVADRIAVMYAGRVVEEGPAQRVFDHPVHPYTQLLLHASADVIGANTPIQSHSATISNGCRFRFRCSKAQAICAESEPALTEIGVPGHLHACHFPEPAPKAEQTP